MIEIKNSLMNDDALLAWVMIFSFFLTRPSALGNEYTPIGLTLLLCLFIYRGLKFGFYLGGDYCGAEKNFVMYLSFLLFYCSYLLFLAMIYGNSHFEYLIKDIISSVVVVIVSGFLFLRKKVVSYFFGNFSLLMGVLGYSSLVTYTYSLFFELSSIHLYTYNIGGYFNEAVEIATGSIYLPFSMAYGQFTSSEGVYTRYSLFFREAGIAQAFACFAAIYEAYTKKRIFIIFGSLAGAFLTFSTFAYFNIAIAVYFIARAMYPGRASGTLALVFFSGLIAFSVLAPGFGLLDKYDTHGGSVDARSYAMISAGQSITEAPLGRGLFRENEAEDANINLVAAISSIGIIGFVLQVLMISGFRGKLDELAVLRISCCTPLLLTAIFSQPIFSSPFVLVMAFVNFFGLPDKSSIKSLYQA